MPRLEEPFGKQKFAKYAPTVLYHVPLLGWLCRVIINVIVELVFVMLLQKKHVKWWEGMVKNTLDETYKMIPEKYHGMMTPDHPYGCKRRIFDDGWRAYMSDPRFTLTNRKIVGVGGRHIALGAPYTAAVSESETVEEKTPADVIVLTNSLKARAGYTRSPCWPRRSLAARCMG
jgi:hypothetical protein